MLLRFVWVLWLGVLSSTVLRAESADSQPRLVEANARTLGTSFYLESDVLENTRHIDIYAPYNESKQPLDNSGNLITYYVFDSNFMFDLVVANLKLKWERGLVPPGVVVGLQARDAQERFANAVPLQTLDGKHVIFDSAKPERLRNFLRDELIPAIEAGYPVNHYRVAIGLSPTATNVVHDYLSATPLFNGHIALAADFLGTPVFGSHSDTALLAQIEQRMTTKPKGFLYFSVSSDDVERESMRGQPIGVINATPGFNQNGVFASIVASTEHYEHISIAVPRALAQLFPKDKWQPNFEHLRLPTTDKLAYLREFYHSLSNHYGFDVAPLWDGYWTIDSVKGVVEGLFRREKWQQARELLSWAVQYTGSRHQPYYYLALSYEKTNQGCQGVKAMTQAIHYLGAEFDSSAYETYRQQLVIACNQL